MKLQKINWQKRYKKILILPMDIVSGMKIRYFSPLSYREGNDIVGNNDYMEEVITEHIKVVEVVDTGQNEEITVYFTDNTGQLFIEFETVEVIND